MNFLITGGAGFIGSNLARIILERGDSVRILDDMSTGKYENIHGLDVDMIEGDIRDEAVLRHAVKDMDYVLHHAAVSSVKMSLENPVYVNDVNIMGSLKLLEASATAGLKGFVLASSAAVYGDDPVQPKCEAMTPKPLSPYAVSKLSIEYMCYHYSQFRGLPAKVLRYFNIFGPNQDPESEYSAVIPRFIRKFIDNENPIVYGDGLQTRDFLYVDNIADAIYRLIAHNGFIISNLASGRSISLLELIDLLKNISGTDEIIPEFKDARQADIKHSSADITMARQQLGWTPKVDMKEGLERTFAYYRTKYAQ